MKNILVTGGLGFIGFNAIQLWKRIRPEYNYVVVDLNTDAASFMLEKKLKWLDENDIDVYQRTDISSHKMYKIVDSCNIDSIVNFAAESHVDNSIHNPNVFFESNVMGVVNLLNICRDRGIRLHQVSTDEVIGTVSPEDVFKNGRERKGIADETAKFNPSSPYSSSKASAELICNSYVKTFGVDVTISRCTNNFGPWQNPEKLIPLVISNALSDKDIPVYGDGKQRRFWIHVDEHNKAIMDILEFGKMGETYNISPKFNVDELTGNLKYNINVVKKILKYLGKSNSLIKHVGDRPAHDMCYFLTGKKILKDCGYYDKSGFDKCLRNTVDWYVENMK